MAAINRTWRVKFRGGWLGLFTGESQGKAMERVLPEMNQQGYRVVFIVSDKFSLVKKFLVLLLAVVTLGFVVLVENLLIVGEQTT